MELDDLRYEREAVAAGYRHVAGVDEVGRGPLAGPVVAAAVILGDRTPEGVMDSKKLTARRRAELAEVIGASCTVSVAIIPAAQIDRSNIRIASLDAMQLALSGLARRPDYAFVDGNALPPDLPCPAETVVRGDAKVRSIAAASIVAKVLRDRMMERADTMWAGYGFASHKGYPTRQHRDALTASGPCVLHRVTFAPVRAASTVQR